MWSLERHRDVGAYALGVLDPAERFRFEDHLPECGTCASLVGELAPTTGVLAVYARATPPCVEAFARPAPTLLDRAVDRLGALHRRARRRLWGAAVAAVLVLAATGQESRCSPGSVRVPGTRRRCAATTRGPVWRRP